MDARLHSTMRQRQGGMRPFTLDTHTHTHTHTAPAFPAPAQIASSPVMGFRFPGNHNSTARPPFTLEHNATHLHADQVRDRHTDTRPHALLYLDYLDLMKY